MFSVLNMGNSWDYARLPWWFGFAMLVGTIVVEDLLFWLVFRRNKQVFEIVSLATIANIVTFFIGWSVGMVL